MNLDLMLKLFTIFGVCSMFLFALFIILATTAVFVLTYHVLDVIDRFFINPRTFNQERHLH